VSCSIQMSRILRGKSSEHSLNRLKGLCSVIDFCIIYVELPNSFKGYASDIIK
jgi:hypothetical protein